jgi:diguanylate cyclase (GGDEF)-like protein
MQPHQERFEELKQAGDLPSPAGVGMRILMLTQRDDCSVEDIAHTIDADPALTGRIIKLATSSQQAGVCTISTVKEAAVRLGLRTVRNVALGFSLVAGNRRGACQRFDYDRFWSWSLANAVAAKAISQEVGVGLPAEVFTCGLLLRVGRLALATVHPTDYAAVLEEVEEDSSALLSDLEDARFNINHREVGALLLEDWGLPSSFSEVLRLFEGRAGEVHNVEHPEANDLLRIIDVSSAVAGILTAETDRQHELWPILRRVCEGVAVDPEHLCKILDDVAEEWRQWGEMLKVPTSEVQPFSTIHSKGEAYDADRKVQEAAQFTDPSQGLRILAVDDDPVSLKLLTKHLEKAGHSVTTATNGKEALGLALQSSPQIVVTDWMMPEMDGIQLCKALRRFPSGQNIYVLILTGRAEEDRVVQAFGAGVDDYIVKPFKPRLLHARIRSGKRVVLLQEQAERDKQQLSEKNAKLSVLTRKLSAAAMSDALTDMPNRRYAMKRLEMEWATSARSGSPMSLIMADIDLFKAVNDTYGHDVGDLVLKQTAKAINRSLRRGDTCARIGGEEFLVICPDTDLETAYQIAERIRESVEINRMVSGEFDGSVTMSLGVAQRTPGIATIDELLKAADEAVYVAKRSGRNRVDLYVSGADEDDGAAQPRSA